MIQIYYTLNPHINNLSMNKLKSDFRYCLQKYYRKFLGQRYYKHKDKQYKIAIFPEVGKREIKEPHLHMLVELPLNEMKGFHKFITENMKKIYTSLTDNLQVEYGTPVKLWEYNLKEDFEIITKTDLFEKHPYKQ